jgi:ornithine--oxo-acid transaminase
VAIESLEVLKDERLAENALELGELFREELRALRSPHIRQVRGKGLLNAVVIEHPRPDAALELCLALKENGLLAKPTHGDKIRLAPPLVITRAELAETIAIVNESLSVLDR